MLTITIRKLLDVLRRWWYGGRMKIDKLDGFRVDRGHGAGVA